MIVVPEMAAYGRHNIGEVVARAWEEVVGKFQDDNVFNAQWLFEALKKDPEDFYARLEHGINNERHSRQDQ